MCPAFTAHMQAQANKLNLSKRLKKLVVTLAEEAVCLGTGSATSNPDRLRTSNESTNASIDIQRKLRLCHNEWTFKESTIDSMDREKQRLAHSDKTSENVHSDRMMNDSKKVKGSNERFYNESIIPSHSNQENQRLSCNDKTDENVHSDSIMNHESTEANVNLLGEPACERKIQTHPDIVQKIQSKLTNSAPEKTNLVITSQDSIKNCDECGHKRNHDNGSLVEDVKRRKYLRPNVDGHIPMFYYSLQNPHLKTANIPR